MGPQQSERDPVVTFKRPSEGRSSRGVTPWCMVNPVKLFNDLQVVNIKDARPWVVSMLLK